MKKILSAVAIAGALSVPVIAAPSASAAGDCPFVSDGYTMTVRCYNTAPGDQFQLVVRCPDGLRWSAWQDQGHWTTDRTITMQCHGIQVHTINYR